jgi:hypothetical protein
MIQMPRPCVASTKSYRCRCGVFGCGATRANSRLVGNPSFGDYFPLARDPGVSEIDRPLSLLIPLEAKASERAREAC